ncbi:MAG TPA: hypothetical protein ENJ78_00995 [candidate division WWE3 bacterium]|uniref:prephenate dehydratase n=1 Tax=candidate division WWE3 bacterium TaxID=2053526 RepID=A0A7V5MH63_UNCKA|nr:hypothetical protein [candidate division WWE3 bacterium]
MFVKNKPVIFGIQGGVGSFNEEATNSYCLKRGIITYKMKYLYTTARVLEAVENNTVDYGIFAIHNSVGGVVWESARALAEYRVRLLEEFYIVITHHLMKRPDVSFSSIKKIVAHPQVFKQCSQNLKKFFPNLEQISGEGDYIDTAKAAEAVSKGILPKNYAVLGPKSLSALYNLEVVKSDLQDLKTNKTYFFLVSRYS